MAAVVSFALDEVDAVRKMLASAALDSGGRTKLLQSIGAEMESQTQERFSTQKAPDGKPWKALAQKTRDYYSKIGKRADMLLNFEGKLLDSITSEVQGGAWSVLTGAAMEYAAVHQFGAVIRPKSAKALMVPGYGRLQKVTIPARPYLGVSPDNAKQIAALTAAFLAGSLS